MLIRKLSRKMIARINNQFMYLALTEKDSTFSHIPSCHRLSRTQFFHSLKPPLNNPKLFAAKSSAQTPISLSVESRVARTDAQAALFDYLHCTRGMSFLDAEHISQNSPHFLNELISKVEKEKDVTRALARFFRYHPINEFEPFFESLGLEPKEFSSLLPRELNFLSDDQLLIDNYHTLSDYGVPRSKIGRIYMEVNEIFKYELGVLHRKLRAYEQLGLSRSTVIKLVSCSPRLLVGDVNSALVKILDKLKELGFRSDWIGGYLSSKYSNNWSRMRDTLHFLGEVGYSDEDMQALFRKDLSLLFEACGKQIYVVVGALLKLGLKMTDIYNLVLASPEILSPKCGKNFWKALRFLIEIGLEDKDIAKILSTHIKFLSSHSIKGPKTVLKVFNNDKQSLCEALKRDSGAFLNLALKSKVSNPEHFAARNPNNIANKTEFLLKIGYVENSEEMLKALKRFRGRGDQLQERFDCLLQAGLDFNEVSSMVKHAPTVLNQSKEILEKKIDCLREYLGYPIDAIVGFPSYLCYDMERISLRFSMYAWLRENGGAKPMMGLGTILACSETRFMKYFVNIHPDGPAVWENLKKSLTSG